MDAPPAPPPGRSARVYAARLAALAAAYVVTARWGLSWHAVSGVATTVWPPSGLSLACLFLGGLELWPAVAAGAFLVNAAAGVPWAGALGIAAGNTAEALLGVAALRAAGFRPSLERVRDVLSLVLLAAVGSTLVSATVGTCCARLAGTIPPSRWGAAWGSWWVGDMMGDLLVGPLLFTWAAGARPWALPDGLREAFSLAALVFATAMTLAGSWLEPALAPFAHLYFAFPLLIWAAFRFGPRGASAGMLAVTGVSIWGTASGLGPFASVPPETGLIQLQLFVGITSVTLLVLAAVAAERDAAESETRWLNRELDGLVVKRTAELERSRRRYQTLIEAAPDVIFSIDRDGLLLSLNPAFEKVLGWRIEEWLGRTIQGLVHPEDRPALEAELRKAASAGPTSAVEVRFLARDGSVRLLQAAPRPLFDAGGVAAVLGVARDVTERRKAEEERDRRERMFRAIAEHSPDVIARFDKDLRHLYVNPAVERIAGRPASEFIGKTNAELGMPEELVELWESRIRTVFLRGSEATLEFEYPSPGGVRHFQSRLVPEFASDGTVEAVMGVTRDFTEFKAAEAAIRTSEERFRLLVEGVRDHAIFMLDAEGRVATWNAGAQRLEGYGAWEIVGRHFSCFYTEEDREAGVPEGLLDRARAEGRALAEGWRVRKDGSRFWADVLVSALKDESGSVTGFAKITRDATDRRRAREAVESLAMIVASSQDAIIGMDVEGVVRTWNAGAERIYGWSEKEAVGRPIAFLAPPERRQELSDMLRRLSRGERVDQFETQRVAKDGRLLTVSISASPIRDASGRVAGISAIMRDVTEIKRIQALTGEIEERRRMDQLKDQLLGVVSHELRTPITIVQTALFNLTEQAPGPLNAAQSRMLELATKNAQRLARMIENLLDLSRLESGKSKINRRRLDLADLLRGTVEDFPRALVKPGVTISLDLPADLPSVDADADMAAQVLVNLVENACRFARRKVVVRARAEELAPKPGAVRVSVLDDGPGIPAQAQGELFSKFYQVDRPKGGGGYKGTGLGLAICREIMALHGGRIWVESAEGRGAAFHLLFGVHAGGRPLISRPPP